MRSAAIAISFLFSCMLANAQQNYDASLIPKELTSYANAVVRDQETSIQVEDLNNTIVHVKTAVTILNKNGDDMAHIGIEHDKSTVIKSIKGIIYNEFGKPAGKFSESDFDDNSAWDGFSLFTDAKVKHYFPAVVQYPYTIAYEYELKLKQSLNFPDWEPVDDFGVAIEKSSFTFSCPVDFNIRYKESNLPGKVAIGKNSNLKTYSWRADNLKAVKHEPFSPYYKNYMPCVQIAPEKFTYYGIPGSFTDWKELGKWNYEKLISTRQQLPEETITFVKELTKDINDPKLKAKKIYEYMQGKTHYVSVQVGIGGYQPFLASDVDKQNYGDCKALVNYTQALLKAVDIESYYCVVESGRNYKVSLLGDFPSMEQGDHIILCVPFKNDTTWADCTSETIPFGYLGPFTDDRTVLACTPEGGKLLHTPKYTAEANLKSRKAGFTINESGELSGNMVTAFKGADYEYRDELVNEPRSEQVKMLQRIYPINNLLVEAFDLKQDKSFNPSTTEDIKLKARDYASFTDGKCYFMLNPVNRIDEQPAQVRNRRNSVYINRGYTDVDEVTYTVPAGYKLEKEPLNISIAKPFANFTATMTLNGNQLTYKRKLQFIDGTYSKDTYQDLVSFYQDVVDADDYTVSLKKAP
jgi:hypothetical protein